MTEKKLSEILSSSAGNGLARAWESSEAAPDSGPLPRGEYVARVVRGQLAHARTGTPCYKLTFEVAEGAYAGRRFWHDLWLTPAALPLTKRDLAKLGLTALEQLDRPLPPGLRCRVQLALREDDDGTRRNRVRHFEVTGVDTPEPDPFAPQPHAGASDQPGGPTP